MKRQSIHKKFYFFALPEISEMELIDVVKKQITEKIDEKNSSVVIDFANQPMIHSELIGKIADLNKKIIEFGGQLVLVNVKQKIQEVFETVLLNTKMAIFKTLEDFQKKWEDVVLEPFPIDPLGVKSSSPLPLDDSFPDKDLEKLIQQKEELEKKYQAVQKEYNGFISRIGKEYRDSFLFANESLLQQILEILDNFDRAKGLDKTKTDFDRYFTGIQLIANQFENLLKKYNIQKIDIKDQPFNPLLHEKKKEIQQKDKLAGTILEELKPGYRIRDKILRKAQVVIAQ